MNHDKTLKVMQISLTRKNLCLKYVSWSDINCRGNRKRQVINYKFVQVVSQSAFTDLTVETVEQDVKSKLTIKTPERRQWRRSGVFIINFEHLVHLVLVFLLLTLSR